MIEAQTCTLAHLVALSADPVYLCGCTLNSVSPSAVLCYYKHGLRHLPRKICVSDNDGILVMYLLKKKRKRIQN